MDALKSSTGPTQIPFTDVQQAVIRFNNAAKELSITLRDDLVANLNKAREAENAFISAGFAQEGPVWQQIEAAIAKANKELQNFGQNQDTFLSKTHLWQQFQKQLEGGVHGMDEMKLSGVQAFDSLETNIGSAFQSIVLGQGNVAKALERSTAQALASLTSQAAVKSIFYLAEGFATMSTDPAASTDYLTASAEMAAVAVAAGAAGRGLSSAAGGGGSSGTNDEQLHTSTSNTTGQAASNPGVSGVQQFATGALVTGPTLAMVGEAGTEAVLPLSDPEAMNAIGRALASHVRGAGGTHFHIEGMISSDNLAKVMKQMNKLVTKGQAELHASNTFRITKRSA